MSFLRRRSARPNPARRRPGSNLETLESRQMLTGSPYLAINDYPLTDSLPFVHPGQVPSAQIAHPIGSNPALLATYQNQGRHLAGQDRQGNRWTLDLTGPGQIIVTDISPNDGVLDDNLNTITLIGTNTKSVLIGRVEQSARVQTDSSLLPTLGLLQFNSLQATQPVKTVILNGFILTDTITPVGSSVIPFSVDPNDQTQVFPAETQLNQTTGINLRGGVSTLAIEAIDARMPQSFTPQPIVVQVGNPTTPLTVHPNIRIDHIYNTVYDDTAFATGGSKVIPTGPQTLPTVELRVNGAIKNFDVVSITQQPDLSKLFPPLNNSTLTIPPAFIPTDSAALEYQFPTVGTTGRTAVRATSIGNIKVTGAATNVTFSKSAQPFQNSLTGLNSLGTAQFGSTTDAVAIDSRGSIGGLKFAKGLGNPAGSAPTTKIVKTNTTTISPVLNPINYGQPASKNGYAAAGYVGVQVVTEGNIGHIVAAPSGQFFQISQDPSFVQSGLNGYTTYVTRPGTALTTSLVAAGGSIGATHIVGDLQNSEIKSGYNYYSALGGAEGVNAPSKIGPVKIRGNITNSVVSSSYRPNDGIYGNGNDTAGNGTITGTHAGQVYVTPRSSATTTVGGTTTTTTIVAPTVLGNQGSGFYARHTSARPAKAVKTHK